MAVSRHLEYYRTANSAIRSTDPENSSLKPNMACIRCTVCEIFDFKLYCDLETGVWSHSRSSKVALFDRAHMTVYSSIRLYSKYASIYYHFRDIAAYWSSRWLSAAILDFWHSKVAPLDRPTQKTPPKNQTSCLYVVYSRSYASLSIWKQWRPSAI